jgi:hypothetical protein
VEEQIQRMLMTAARRNELQRWRETEKLRAVIRQLRAVEVRRPGGAGDA